jgi:hypothetical protein
VNHELVIVLVTTSLVCVACKFNIGIMVRNRNLKLQNYRMHYRYSRLIGTDADVEPVAIKAR